jgi:hypothetical protein
MDYSAIGNARAFPPTKPMMNLGLTIARTAEGIADSCPPPREEPDPLPVSDTRPPNPYRREHQPRPILFDGEAVRMTCDFGIGLDPRTPLRQRKDLVTTAGIKHHPFGE